MSAYDVHIGKLISGRRELEGKGVYLLCTPEKTITEMESSGSVQGILVSSQDWEDALYEFCQSALTQYIEAGHNKDVYTFSIQVDTYHGSLLVHINNAEGLNQSIEDALPYERSRASASQTEQDDSQLRGRLRYELQYAEADYPFMYDEYPQRLGHWLGMLACIKIGTPEYLDVEQYYIFEKKITDSQLFLLAINVIHRLQEDLRQLHQTDSFIAYVSAADGVGGDTLTTSQLIRKCISKEKLYQVMPEAQEMDLAFQAAVLEVQKKSVQEQVLHWTTAIEQGEFGKNSPQQYEKTDYASYEQLLSLGESAIPYLSEQLQTELEEDTKLIIEMVLQDLS